MGQTRDALRTLIYTPLPPVGREILAELRENLDTLKLDFSDLNASCDIRARAYSALNTE